jgi:hypothetical protein
MNSILTENDSNVLMNAINHYKSIQHQEQLSYITMKNNLLIVEKFNLIPYKDGSDWCVLLGKNIQEGICGFGNTPLKAILNFNNNFYNNM